MRRLFSVAARNLLRNKRRTAFAAAAIIIGVGVSLFLKGFIGGFIVAGLDDSVFGRTGAIQVHAKGYKNADRDLLEYDLDGTDAFGAKLRAVPGVTAAAPRLFFEGMISNGTISTVFNATGIDARPAREYAVCPVRRANVENGPPLDDKSDADAIVGATIVSFLGATPGSSLTVTSSTKQGAVNALDLTVRGTIPTRFIFDSKRAITVPFAFAQRLLRMEGRASYWALSVADLDRVGEVAARVRAAIGSDYEVETWKDITPDLRDRIDRTAYVLGIVVIVLALLVASSILNTMLMSVYERVREIGTMMAVGTRRRQVLLLFFLEAAVLGAIGTAVGIALGWTVVHALAAHGVMFRPPGGEPLKIVPFVPAAFVGGAAVLAVVGTMLAASFPAWKASRLSPVEALRSN